MKGIIKQLQNELLDNSTVIKKLKLNEIDLK